MKRTQIITALVVLAVGQTTSAQHSDVLLQRDGNKIATGTADFDGAIWNMGTRVFSRNFPSDYLVDNPGFNALSATSPALPPGFSALPGSSAVSWDFLPMTIDCTVSNLWYWNGQDLDGNGVDLDDVRFTLAPGYSLALESASGAWFAADGSDQLVPGGSLGNTGSNGSLHVHRYFQLASGSASNPAAGVYLIAMQARMSTLESSDPFFIAFGTPGFSTAVRNVAVAWVQQRVDELASHDQIIPGDFNCDCVVDAADYVVWRKLGMSSEEYQVWRAHFGEQSIGIAGSGLSNISLTVPEPANSLLLAIAILLGIFRRHFARSSCSEPRNWPGIRSTIS